MNTTVWMPAPADEERGVDAFVRSDAEQLPHLVAMVDRGELRVDIGRPGAHPVRAALRSPGGRR